MRSNKLFLKARSSLNMVGLASIVVIMLVTTVDVVLRYFFNSPLRGAFEISELIMVVVVFFGLGYTQSVKAHVRVDILVSHLSIKSQLLVDLLNTALSLSFFGLVVWRSLLHAAYVWQSGEYTDLLQIPMAPFKFLVPFGIGLFCIELIIDMVCIFREILRGKK